MLPLSCTETYFYIFKKFFCPTSCEMACIVSDVMIKRSWFIETSCNETTFVVSVFGLCMKLLRHPVARQLVTSRWRDSFRNAFDSSNYFFFLPSIGNFTSTSMRIRQKRRSFHIFGLAELTKSYWLFRMTVDGEVAVTTEFAWWKCKVMFVTVMSRGLGASAKLKFVSIDHFSSLMDLIHKSRHDGFHVNINEN